MSYRIMVLVLLSFCFEVSTGGGMSRARVDQKKRGHVKKQLKTAEALVNASDALVRRFAQAAVGASTVAKAKENMDFAEACCTASEARREKIAETLEKLLATRKS